MAGSSTKVLLTDREVAARLQCTPWLVWRLTKDGELRSIKVGRLRRYREEDVEAYLAAHSEGGAA
jgi:excisionase family DNA binding protein